MTRALTLPGAAQAQPFSAKRSVEGLRRKAKSQFPKSWQGQVNTNGHATITLHMHILCG